MKEDDEGSVHDEILLFNSSPKSNQDSYSPTLFDDDDETQFTKQSQPTIILLPKSPVKPALTESPILRTLTESSVLPALTESPILPKFTKAHILSKPIQSPNRPVLRSRIPPVDLNVVPRRTVIKAKPVVTVIEQKSVVTVIAAKPEVTLSTKHFDDMNWEEMNAYLENRYPWKAPGERTLRRTGFAKAYEDRRRLRLLLARNIPEFALIPDWIEIITQAINRNSYQDSDEESAEEGYDRF